MNRKREAPDSQRTILITIHDQKEVSKHKTAESKTAGLLCPKNSKHTDNNSSDHDIFSNIAVSSDHWQLQSKLTQESSLNTIQHDPNKNKDKPNGDKDNSVIMKQAHSRNRYFSFLQLYNKTHYTLPHKLQKNRIHYS